MTVGDLLKIIFLDVSSHNSKELPDIKMSAAQQNECIGKDSKPGVPKNQ